MPRWHATVPSHEYCLCRRKGIFSAPSGALGITTWQIMDHHRGHKCVERGFEQSFPYWDFVLSLLVGASQWFTPEIRSYTDNSSPCSGPTGMRARPHPPQWWSYALLKNELILFGRSWEIDGEIRIPFASIACIWMYIWSDRPRRKNRKMRKIGALRR